MVNFVVWIYAKWFILVRLCRRHTQDRQVRQKKADHIRNDDQVEHAPTDWLTWDKTIFRDTLDTRAADEYTRSSSSIDVSYNQCLRPIHKCTGSIWTSSRRNRYQHQTFLYLIYTHIIIIIALRGECFW